MVNGRMDKVYEIVLLLTTLHSFTKSQLSMNNSSAAMLVCVPIQGPCSCEQEGIVNCNGEKLETVNLKIANDNGVVVEQLNMQENMLTKLRKGEVMPRYEKQLMRLDLRRNLIHQIEPAVFSSMINLHDLLLSNNKLTELQSSIFDNVDLSLRNLDLSHNLLESIDNSPFENLHLLLYLYLDDNPLKRITNTSFEGLSSLLELSMENTKLKFIPKDAFKSLDYLEVLSLRNNQLETVPQLSNLKKLNRLVLSGNPILRISTYAFQLFPNLENIQLRHMPQLTLVEDCAFCTLNHLNTIAITDSPLLKLLDPFAFGSNISLKYNLKIVDFSNNSLQSLDKELLPWENVTEIWLANNSFRCDESLNWMFDIGKKLHGNITCIEKNDLNGNFTILKKDNSCCSKNGRILFSFLVLPGCSCGIGFSTEKVYGGFICLCSKLYFFIYTKILQPLMIQKSSLTLIMMFYDRTFNYTKRDISKFIRWKFNRGRA
ncbi:Leucine-rich repeat neuronal protein 2 [Trichinella pseudospiralis]|uniref:Leucine-rich repeat neuronal protein 2 n=2 Tax=Trichinella pseudospiralis TaxID=6337 RepID=A0A0V1KBA0_TRIPS|nr:Leucine-rich repeat neuronal protein 2 [Trichinella pseudospiralis]KRY93765.1 Leucine-rich repeat neuronal protein 2 [Trichinella pseudospiralis]KRZ28643.1 Leucine-rich repeat neuronal protein 2 [Trichinella pseudospiralis]KRZ44477.1 Leucine-rich repeat neuronal protein 2 [Trichinella pseudospiralis]